MITVGAFEAKTHLSRLLSEVEIKKENILIRRRGKAIAVIIPAADFEKQRRAGKKEAILNGFRNIRKSQKVKTSLAEIKALINAGRKY